MRLRFGLSDFDPTSKTALLRLHGAIVERRYAASDWRSIQNFVGETVAGYREEVHFICPRPEDVPALMEGWMALTRRVVNGGVDAVVAAAVSSFSFVFIHPFEDGNGRIHRFLMHHILSKRGFTPAGIIFPVSAAILRDRHKYDAVLASFSRPLFDFIDWGWNNELEIVAKNDTSDLYRYFDATALAEYLYDRVADTVTRDLKEELGFVAVFDGALNAVRNVVDMPDRRAALLVRLCMQNSGRLSGAKRRLFSELTDAEVAAMEAAVQEAMQAGAQHPE
jgi:Fic/DOC family